MKFYKNMECRIIAELPNDESVIELATGIYYDGNQIEAETLSDALDIAHDMYNAEEIVLDASDFMTNTIEEYIP